MLWTRLKEFFIHSNVGRKTAVGLTGLVLSLFILTHLLGNFLLFVGPKAYNMYSHALISNPLIYIIEIFLLLSFLFHGLWALAITFANKKKKGVSRDPHTSFIHKTLWIQGVIVLVFVILHLITFKYGPYYTVEYDGKEVRDLFLLVAEVFQKPIYVIWYIVSLIILSFHLAHGLQASIRSLGFYHELYTPLIRKVSLAYGVFTALGFIAQPLYFFFFYQGAGIGS